MALDNAGIKSLLESQIISRLGMTAELRKKTSTTNKYGEETSNTYTDISTITVIPTSANTSTLQLESSGNFPSGDILLYVRESVDAEVQDRIFFDLNLYEIVGVKEEYFSGAVIKLLSLVRRD